MAQRLWLQHHRLGLVRLALGNAGRNRIASAVQSADLKSAEDPLQCDQR